MALQGVALLVLALFAGLARADSYNLTDYRIVGHMTYKSVLPDSTTCQDSWLVACAGMGQFTVRASPADIKVLPPVAGLAIFHGQVITCPQAESSVVYDSNGRNGLATGSFYPDPAHPDLVPLTTFTMASGGGDNGLQLRIPATGCIYTFTLTDATNYILDTQPVQWRSIFSSAAFLSSTPHAAVVLAGTAAALLATWVLG